MKSKKTKISVSIALSLVLVMGFAGTALAYSGYDNPTWNYSLFGYVQYGTDGPTANAVQYFCYVENRDMEWEEIDCIIGPNSVEYIKQLQRNYGLTADGIVGSQTWGECQARLADETYKGGYYEYTITGTVGRIPYKISHHSNGRW